tara:strand:- start:1891 stop:2940 length:1050 start_codon:yes stop_codon:yes gene_type:complete
MGKHLITGGSGYVGNFITKKLSEMGEEIISLDIIENNLKFNNVEYVIGSVLDKELINSLVSSCDYVHHNAALVPLTKSGNDFNKVNLRGTSIVANAAINHSIKHLSHMSSSAVFGLPNELPLNNFSERKPVEIYGESKKDAEDLVMSLIASNPNFSCSIIRPRTILGTDRLGIFELLFRWISKGKDIFVIGEATEPFQFAHIEDIVNASINSCIKRNKGVFNIGTLEFNSLTQDLEALIEFANTKSRIIHLPESLTINGLKIMDKLNLSPFAPWHYLTYHKPFYFDSSYVYDQLNYLPKGSNIEIMIESYKSYLSNLNQHNISVSSPHKSKLKSTFIDLTANLISKINF